MAQLFFSTARNVVLGIACALAMFSSSQAINIQFNYQFDTQGFFNLQPRRDALEEAADVFRVFTDNLTAISPGSVYNQGTPQEFTDTWTAIFEHPGQAGQQSVIDLAVPANTVVIYAGGKNHTGSTLGFGGPGGYTVNGVQNFVDSVSTRGQANTTGLMPTDFARWGGQISFDTHTSDGQTRQWHTDLNTIPAPGAVDLYTVAVHELGHLFGFSIGPSENPLSFQTYLDTVNDRFNGPKVLEVHGNYALTATDNSAHWRSNVTSTTENGGSQLAIMGPNISPGTRRFFTLLDYAAMDDIGWQVPQSIYDLPTPGDYDGSGTVNAADYAVWRQNFGSTSSLSADGNQSGRIDAADYALWRDHLGTSGGSGSVAAVVPEPAGMVLAFVGTLCLWFLACRRGF